MDITASTTSGASLPGQATHSIASGVTVSNASSASSIALTIASGINATRTIVTNNGTVTSTGSGRAVGHQNNDYITLTNNGTINATSSGYAVQLNDNITLTNNGQISATGNRAVRLNDNASIINYGQITGTAATEHTVQLNLNASLTNYGSISASGDQRAVNIQTGDIVNHGTITTSGSGRALQISTSGTVTNAATGIISSTGTGDASRFLSGTFTNNGLISSVDNNADGIDLEATGTTATIHNYGRIVAGDKGINDKLDAGALTVHNYGYISGRDTGIASEKGATVVNHGQIVGQTDDGIDFDGIGTITNYGSISCNATPGTTPTGPDSAEGITLGGGTVTNHGSITSAHNGIYGVISASAPTPTAAGATTIVNTGTINGAAGYGIRMFGTFNDVLENSGTIVGGIGIAVDMGAGDDQVTITGGRIQGMIDGGQGNDTIIFNMGTGGSFRLETGLTNFETISLQSGTVEIAGALINGILAMYTNAGLGFNMTRGAATVTGGLNLGGTLSLSQVSGLGQGNTYTLLNNTSLSPIGGAFANASEGTTLFVDGGEFRISYLGGDGNDLTLTVLRAVPFETPVVIVDPTPPPPVIPTFQTETIDGVTVTTHFGGLTSGAASHAVTVPTITSSSAAIVNIPLAKTAGGQSLLTAKLGIGHGLDTLGSAASLTGANAATDFGKMLQDTLGTTGGDLLAGAQGYFNGLGTGTRVIVASVTPTWADGATGTITFTGQTDGRTVQEALLVDARGQTVPTIALEAIDFATILGAARVIGSGSGSGQKLLGDSASQTFLLGNGNDTVSAGGGNDRIQAGGGNNAIDGGAGIDVVRLSGTSANARITANSDGSLTVTTASGTDTLSNIEILRFDDGIRLVAPKAVTSGRYTVQEDFYLAENPDVAAAVKAGNFASGAEHFAVFGHREGRSATALFDAALYLSQNTDVAAAVRAGQTTAYDHFITFGWKEGRTPSAWFDTEAYLLNNPDAVSADINPLTHFLLGGSGQTATPADTGVWA